MIKTAVILPNKKKDEDLRHTAEVVSRLCARGIEARIPAALGENVEGAFTVSEKNALYDGADVIIVLGGDGSILNAAQESAYYGIPILAVNLGRLGYIAQLEISDIPKIADILENGFETEIRSMLEVTLIRGDNMLFSGLTALNDAVISKSKGHGVIELETLCNGVPLIKYSGDGLIAATSTGSTAYAMSAGGAVIDSSLDIIEIAPICAHSLKARPIVFKGEDTIDIRCLSDNDNVCVTLDGAKQYDLLYGDIVRICISNKKASFIKAGNSGFCKILYYKMSDR